jgi:hypothetical protein
VALCSLTGPRRCHDRPRRLLLRAALDFALVPGMVLRSPSPALAYAGDFGYAPGAGRRGAT